MAAVLREYNPGSAYVNLSHWEGVACGECGCRADADQIYYCDGCDQEVCEECSSVCDACGRSRCRGCLDHDEATDRDLCAFCRRSCPRCGRTIALDDDLEACCRRPVRPVPRRG